MTLELQKHFALWLGYSLFLTSSIVSHAWRTNSFTLFSVVFLVLGVFSIGWFSARLDAEHMKDKAATEKPAPVTTIDEEEKKWRSLLHKKEPWER